MLEGKQPEFLSADECGVLRCIWAGLDLKVKTVDALEKNCAKQTLCTHLTERIQSGENDGLRTKKNQISPQFLRTFTQTYMCSITCSYS